MEDRFLGHQVFGRCELGAYRWSSSLSRLTANGDQGFLGVQSLDVSASVVGADGIHTETNTGSNGTRVDTGHGAHGGDVWRLAYDQRSDLLKADSVFSSLCL